MLPGYAATTVTAVCDAHGMFLSVATGHPGASHDADALQASDIPGKLSTLPPGYYVVGDGGYGASTKMVIPFAHKVGRSSEVRRGPGQTTTRRLCRGRYPRGSRLTFTPPAMTPLYAGIPQRSRVQLPALVDTDGRRMLVRQDQGQVPVPGSRECARLAHNALLLCLRVVSPRELPEQAERRNGKPRAPRPLPCGRARGAAPAGG